MSKAVPKIMHISSEEQSQQNEQQIANANKKKTPLPKTMKYQSFKTNNYHIKKNIFYQDDVDLEYNQVQLQERKPILQLVNEGEVLFDGNQIESINKSKQQSSQSDGNQKQLLEQLNMMNLTEAGEIAHNPETRPNKKASMLMKKLIKLQFQQSQEEENDNQNVKIDVKEQVQLSSQSQPNNKESEGAFKQFVLQEDQTKIQFINRRIKDNQRLSVFLQRQKSGMSYFLPQMNMLFKNDFGHILSCKKQMGANFQYIISINSSDFAVKTPSYCARIQGNFTNSVFNLIDDKAKSVLCTTRFKQENTKNIIAPMIYQIYILNEGERYSDLVGTYGDNYKGLDQLYTITVNKKKISYFRNKKPQYNDVKHVYALNFDGRVGKGSVKNFLIEDSKSGRQVLMFGRSNGQKQIFNMEISAPLSPLLGLGIVLPQFASKMLQK